MTDRSDNTRRTVARMKIEALESAAAHQRDVEAASRARRIERVASVIVDLAERFEDDHGAQFEALGITIEIEDGPPRAGKIGPDVRRPAA